MVLQDGEKNASTAANAGIRAVNQFVLAVPVHIHTLGISSDGRQYLVMVMVMVMGTTAMVMETMVMVMMVYVIMGNAMMVNLMYVECEANDVTILVMAMNVEMVNNGLVAHRIVGLMLVLLYMGKPESRRQNPFYNTCNTMVFDDNIE